MAEEFSLILQQLPTILQYYVPGYVFINIFDFLTSSKRKSGLNVHLECIVISYIIIAFVHLLLGHFVDLPSLKLIVAIELIFAGASSYLLSMFTQSENGRKILRSLKIHRSMRPSIWDDYIDLKYGTYITVYVTDESVIYVGKLVSYECEGEGDESNYIALTSYEIFDYDWKKIVDIKDIRNVTIIKLDNINRVELYYHENSRIVEKMSS